MTEQLDRAFLFLCEANLPQDSPPERDEAYYLQIIDEADPREVLPEFASQLWTSRSDERIRKLSGYLLRVAEKIPVASWPAIDQALRYRILLPKPSAGPLIPTKAPKMLGWLKPRRNTPDPGHVLIGLCHRDGWTRHAAMKFIDLLPSPLAACLLLVRANDWIPSIRTDAVARIPQIFENLDTQERLRLLPLVVHLRHCGRLEQRSLPETWINLLSQTWDEQAWLNAWGNASPKDQRLYLSLLNPEHHLPGPSIRQALLGSKNRMALIFYLKRIFPHLTEEEQEVAAEFFERSRVVPVRRAWVDHVIDQRPEAAQPLLIKELVSGSRSLRDFARFYLSRLFPMDFRKHYQQMLDGGIHEAGALLGLAEVSPEAAHQEALKRLNSFSPRIRKAVILSLSAPWVEANLPFLLSTHGWHSPAAWSAARKRLTAIPRALGDFVLREFDKLNLPLATSRFLLTQAPHFKKWDGLEYLLAVVADPELKEDAKYAMRIWRRSELGYYSHLPDAHKQRLFHLLDISGLSDRAKENFRFLLEKAE